MEKITLEGRAKINLTLDVLSRRADGYHEVAMIMQSLSLYDTVTLYPNRGEIKLQCDNSAIPGGDENIAVRAAKALLHESGCPYGVTIEITKRIPVAAGLAGGSTDAAAVLRGLNQLYNLGYSQQKLACVGHSIGADVPFCLQGGTALAEGIGEKLRTLKPLSLFHVVLVKPPYPVSTARVYSLFRLEEVATHPETKLMKVWINEGNIRQIPKGLANVLETVTLNLHPDLAQIKTALLEEGALGALMSGSGPTVFGLFAEYETARSAAAALKSRFDGHDIITTTTWPEKRSEQIEP